MPTTKTLTVSLPLQLARAAERTAREERRSKSDVLREALRFYLEDRRWKQLQHKTAARAQALGIRTEDDVEQLVHDLRK